MSLTPISEPEMSTMIETLLNGLMLGALYALFGLGLSISLGVMRMINIAHGDLIVVGAYMTSVVMQVTGVHPLTSLILVVPAMFVLGWMLQRLLLNRVVGRNLFAPLLVTFGLSIVVQNLLQETFSADTRSLKAGAIAQVGFDIGGVSVGLLPVLSACVSVALFAVAHVLIACTHFGRQSRAVADDPSTARLVGVDDRKFFAMVTGFVLAAIAFAAVLYAMRTPFSPSAGPERLLYSFEAVVLGGLGNLWGTFFGGLVIGVAQLFGARISSGLGPFFGHLVFLTMLLARPNGIFARTAR
jgi:branched-chain amino acid transport system permease protein